MAGNFDLADYIQVNERIEAFYKKYPEGSIQTEIVLNENSQVIFKAYAYKDKEDTRPATGHAMEKEGSTFINKTSHIENCETSAVGRALAMLGFEIKKSVASREEVANAVANQNKPTKTKQELPIDNKSPKTTAPKEDFKPLCSSCKKEITKAEHDYSVGKFKKPLCRACQNIVQKVS